MSEPSTDEASPANRACVACRWIALMPQPYGSIEYFCERHQELMPSAGVDKRRCGDFAVDAR